MVWRQSMVLGLFILPQKNTINTIKKVGQLFYVMSAYNSSEGRKSDLAFLHSAASQKG